MVLEEIAGRVGATGGNLIRGSDAGVSFISSPSIAEATLDFERLGYNRDNTRISRRLERASYPGFLTDLDLHSAEELRTLPMYRDFLIPRGADAGAGTIIQGTNNDALIVAIEGFPSHASAQESVAFLDSLRPYLGRATVLSSRLQALQTDNLVDAFNMGGVAIALLDVRGKILGATERFAASFDTLLLDGETRLRAADATTDKQLADALLRMKERGESTSLAVRDQAQFGCAILHLLPARRRARDLFSNVHIFALLSQADNHFLPGADIIAALFDLTPAEARVARSIAHGNTVGDVARQSGVSSETVRTQLKRVFAKTSTSRQGELISLMTRLGGGVGQG